MIKRLLVPSLVLLVSLCMINGSNAYTKAAVQSKACLSVVNSEDALVSIPSCLKLENHSTKTLIKNNLNESIWVKADNADIFSQDRKTTNNNGILIRSGETLPVTLNMNPSCSDDKITFQVQQVDKAVTAIIVSSIKN